MLRTNSKKATENLKKWTVEHFDADGYNDFNGDENNFSDCAKYIYRVFLREKYEGAENYYRNTSMQDIFADWCAGLPSVLDTADYYYTRRAVDVLGEILEETEEERNRYTEAEAEKCMTYLLYRTIKKGVIDKFLEV